jgi:hypothetical protein
MDRVSPPTIATEALEAHGIHQASPSLKGWRYAEVVIAVTRDTRRPVWRADRAIAITSHGVVEITMNDESDLSPLPVRVFRKLDEWRRSRRGQQWPGTNPKDGYSLPVNEVACNGSAAAIPVPPFGLVPAEAARNLAPAVLVSELG